MEEPRYYHYMSFPYELTVNEFSGKMILDCPFGTIGWDSAKNKAKPTTEEEYSKFWGRLTE